MSFFWDAVMRLSSNTAVYQGNRGLSSIGTRKSICFFRLRSSMTQKTLHFLKEIAEKSQTVCFSPDEEGGIRFHIFINYFEELMSAEHKSYIKCDAIMQDKKLSELLAIPELSDEEKELALKMKGILDRIDEETRIDRTTAFRAVLDKMAKEPEENWSLHYMATLLEALLYFMLNEGNEKIDEEEHNE